MLIENIDTENQPKKRNWRKILAYSFTLIILALLLLLEFPVFSNFQATQYFKGNYKQLKIRYDQAGEDNFLPIFRKAVAETLASNAHRYLTNNSVPSININIDFESLEKIKAIRAAMLGRSFMGEIEGYQKASIQHKDKSIPVKIRLKGGRTEHISDPKKWSFRVKTRKGKSLFGMKVFSLQHPKTRGHHREAIFHNFARQQGLIALQYMFVDVSINGENIGMMAAEEVPAKEMLEREGYKEGLLYQLDDINVRRMYHSVVDHIIREQPEKKGIVENAVTSTLYTGHYSRLYRLYYNSLNARIKEITRKKKSDFYQRQRPVAVGLLKGLLEGRIKPSLVFDAEKMGQYFAFLGLWGDSHSASFRNARYYFNPFTYKFEPVVFDSNAYNSNRIWLYPNIHTIRDHELNRMLLTDTKILNAYVAWVEKYYQLAHSDNFEPMMRGFEKQAIADLREQYWYLPELNITSMKGSIAFLKQSIESGDFYKTASEFINDKDDPTPLVLPENYIVPEVLHADLVKIGNRYRLEVHNLLPLDAQITEIQILIDGRTSNTNEHVISTLPFHVDAFYYNQAYTHNDLELINLPGDKKISISGKVRLATQMYREYSFVAKNSFSSIDSHPLTSLTAEKIVASYPFISYDSERRRFNIEVGIWQVNDYIVFPENHSLHVKAGTQLEFSESAGIMVKGSVHITGMADSPVIFNSSNRESGNHWAGVVVMLADQKSTLKHVEFRNTGFSKKESWQLTGGVTFYRAAVDISNVLFENTIAEDALNIVQSDFSFDQSEIRGTRSDGFDADFATGKITASTFRQIGGDGIDFSGSKIQVSESKFNGIHDKAISVGENSQIQISNVSVDDSGTGLAVKDGSWGIISDSEFSRIEYSTLMSYTKKNTYGPSYLKATRVDLPLQEFSVIAQKGNRLSVDDVEISPIKIDIEKLYKKGYMKK